MHKILPSQCYLQEAPQGAPQPFPGWVACEQVLPCSHRLAELPAQLGGVGRSLPLCPLANYLLPFPVHLMGPPTTTTGCPQLSLVRPLHEAAALSPSRISLNAFHFQLLSFSFPPIFIYANGHISMWPQ